MPDVVAVSDEEPEDSGAEHMPTEAFVVDGISKKIHLAPQLSPGQRNRLTQKIKASRLQASSFFSCNTRLHRIMEEQSLPT
jgi:hypothetical protein